MYLIMCVLRTRGVLGCQVCVPLLKQTSAYVLLLLRCKLLRVCEPVHSGVLADGEQQQMAPVKFDDSEKIKMLPKFDDFGSLSDLGSLFSAGPGRSVDMRSGGRQPPRANLSISSPHPMVLQAAHKESRKKGGTPPVANGVPSEPS
jgi:hypothetical protein